MNCESDGRCALARPLRGKSPLRPPQAPKYCKRRILFLIIALYRHEEATDEKERIERCKRPVLPTLLFFEYVVCDFGNLLCIELKTIDVIDCSRNIALTHAVNVHYQNFIFDIGHVALMLGQDYRVEGGLTVTRTSISVSPIE